MMDTTTIAVALAFFLAGMIVGLTVAIDTIARRRVRDRLGRIKRRVA